MSPPHQHQHSQQPEESRSLASVASFAAPLILVATMTLGLAITGGGGGKSGGGLSSKWTSWSEGTACSSPCGPDGIRLHTRDCVPGPGPRDCGEDDISGKRPWIKETPCNRYFCGEEGEREREFSNVVLMLLFSFHPNVVFNTMHDCSLIQTSAALACFEGSDDLIFLLNDLDQSLAGDLPQHVLILHSLVVKVL